MTRTRINSSSWVTRVIILQAAQKLSCDSSLHVFNSPNEFQLVILIWTFLVRTGTHYHAVAHASTPPAAGFACLHSSAWKVLMSTGAATEIQFVMNGHWCQLPAPTSMIVAIHRVTHARNTRDVHGVERSIDAWTTRTQTLSPAKARFNMEKCVLIQLWPTLKWMVILSFGVSLTSEEELCMSPDLAIALTVTPMGFILSSWMEESLR